MNVESLYSSLTVVCSDSEALTDVANKMRFNDVGSVAVVDHGTVIGILTERDLTRALADEVDAQTTTVGDYMTRDPEVVSPETDAVEAARSMVTLGIRHLPVVSNGELVGLISTRDILIELLGSSPS